MKPELFLCATTSLYRNVALFTHLTSIEAANKTTQTNGKLCKILSTLSIFLSLSILTVPTSYAQATATPTNYTVAIDQKTVLMEIYNIHGAPYCTIEQLEQLMSGSKKQFNLVVNKERVEPHSKFYIQHYSLTTNNPASTQIVDISNDSKSKEADCAKIRLSVDNHRRPSTAYAIGNKNFFKLKDLMQILDVELEVDNSAKKISINTSKFFVIEPAKPYIKSARQGRWYKHAAPAGRAYAAMSAYMDLDSPNVVYNEKGSPLDLPHSVILGNYVTGRRLNLPYTTTYNDKGYLDDNCDGFSEGWMPICQYEIGTVKGTVVERAEHGYTYINTNGEVINSAIFFTYASPFEYGRAAVKYKLNNVYYSGLIDRSGKVILQYADDLEIRLYATMISVQKEKGYFYYADYNGRKLDLSREEVVDREQRLFDESEYQKFAQYRKNYKTVRYCGRNIFVVDDTKVVDSENRAKFTLTGFTGTITYTDSNPYFIVKNNEKIGAVSFDGRTILESKYDVIKGVDGDALMAIIDNKAQILVDNQGKVLATSAIACLYASKNGRNITLRVLIFPTDEKPGDILMIYTSQDMSATRSTDKLKTLTKKYRAIPNQSYYTGQILTQPINAMNSAIANNSTLNIYATFVYEHFIYWNSTINQDGIPIDGN